MKSWPDEKTEFYNKLTTTDQRTFLWRSEFHIILKKKEEFFQNDKSADFRDIQKEFLRQLFLKNSRFIKLFSYLLVLLPKMF